MCNDDETQKLTIEQLEKVVKGSVRKHAVAVDIDGVIARYDGWKGPGVLGQPIDGAHEFLAELGKRWFVIIHSTRLAPRYNPDCAPLEIREFITTWLKHHDLFYDEVWHSRGKPLAIAYVDDRGVSCRPQDHESPGVAFADALLRVEFLDKG